MKICLERYNLKWIIEVNNVDDLSDEIYEYITDEIAHEIQDYYLCDGYEILGVEEYKDYLIEGSYRALELYETARIDELKMFRIRE